MEGVRKEKLRGGRRIEKATDGLINDEVAGSENFRLG
jgi:hypothetical protein